MLGSSLVITLDGSGGTAKTLPYVDGSAPFTSVYFLDDGLVTYKATVRHSSDTVKAGTQAFDRHTVTFERYLKPTTTASGSLSQVIYTIRNDPSGVSSDIIDMSEAMSFYMVKAGGIAARLLGKES